MWPFDSEEEELTPEVSEFKDVADEIYNLAETEDAGLSGLQDLYNSYGFEDSPSARSLFIDTSDRLRKKFGDTKAYGFEEALDLAPINMSEIVVEAQDPEEAKLERINKWEEENLKNLNETNDLSYLQAGSQLTRGIKQAAAIQRREFYGKDNYIATDLAVRFGQGAIGPIAEFVGADSVNDFFTEQSDPDRDDSYWSAIASGAGSAAGAIGSGLATGGWGTAAYLGVSGAGSVRKQVEESLENEGTVGEALAAGSIEAVNQAIQAGVGAKVFGGVTKQILGKVSSNLGERVFPRIIKNALLEGGTEAAGQVVSNIASNVGQDKDDDVLEGIGQAGVAGLVVGGAASGVGEYAAQKQSNLAANLDVDSEPVNELRDTITQLEGTPPPPSEVIPAGRLSVDLETPGVELMKLDDGASVIESDGTFHLVKDNNVLQPYEQVKYVTPEVAQNLRELTNSHAPDGTAITLTVNEKGNLVAESDFVTKDLTVNTSKTNSSRVAIPTEDTESGNVPVFVSRTRTTDGIRQNPFMIGTGKVESTAGAAKAGFGGQKVSEYVQARIKKYGLSRAEDLGLAVESFVEDADGVVTPTEVPLITYFPVPKAESSNEALTRLTSEGVPRSMERLLNLTQANRVDVHEARILREQVNTAFLNALAKEGPASKNAGLLNDLLGEVEQINAHVRGIAGGALGAANEQGELGAVGQLKVSQLLTDLNQQAAREYQAETGEELNFAKLNAERDAAEVEMSANAPKENVSEDGKVTQEFNDPENQKKYDAAKERFEKAVEKINKGEEKTKKYLEQFTPEDQKTVADLHDLLSTAKPGTEQAAIASAIFDIESKFITKDSSPEMFERIFNFYRGNLLSGPSTQLRNFLGNLSSGVSNVLGLIGNGDFKLAGLYAKEWLKGTPEAFREAGEILKGNRAGRFKFDERVKDSEGNVKNLGKVPPLDNPLTFIQNAMYRLLNAQDMVFYRSSHSAMSYLAEEIANKNISDPALRKQTIEQNLYRTPEQLAKIREQVNARKETLSKAGIELTPTQVEEMVYERMEQSRADRTREIANKHAEKSIFVNDPTGVMGAFYDTIEGFADKFSVNIGGSKVRPIKFLMPFTRVAANITSHLMEFTPVGTLKALKNNPNAPTDLLNHGMTEGDAKMVMGRSIVGSMMMGAAFSIAYAYKDEEKPFIEFYGYPPKGKWKEWKEQGIDNYSLRIGNTMIPLQGTSLAIIPAIVGGSMEAIRNGADVEDVIKAGSVASMGAVSTMSFLKPAGDLFEYIIGSKDNVTSESGSSKKKFQNFWKGQADTLASGLIPASGFLNNLGRWMNESPTESYNNLSAKILGEMPFAREAGIGEPQLNMFGEPITIPLYNRFAAGLAPHTIKTDPVFLWMQETGYDVPDQGPVLRLTTKAEKQRFAASQLDESGYADVLSEEQSREVLEISGPQIKAFMENISRQPRFQVKTEAGQKYINENVNQLRARAKLQVLSRPAAE